MIEKYIVYDNKKDLAYGTIYKSSPTGRSKTNNLL